MKRFFLGMCAAVLAATAIGAAIVFSGAVNVAADDPHHPLVLSLLTTVREHSIEARARNLAVPTDLADGERLRRGAGNYAAMCAECHLGPGDTDSELRSGLYPQPPDLTRGAAEGRQDPGDSSAARRFWVIKHGVKATGMPAWGRAGLNDDNVWDLVAFVQALPTMGPAEYRAWVAASDGHVHGDGVAAADNDSAHAHQHENAHGPGDAHGTSAAPTDHPRAEKADGHSHSHDAGHKH